LHGWSYIGTVQLRLLLKQSGVCRAAEHVQISMVRIKHAMRVMKHQEIDIIGAEAEGGTTGLGVTSPDLLRW